MTLIEFIKHLAHRSIKIRLYDLNKKLVYEDTIGTYVHSIKRNIFDDCKIMELIPDDSDIFVVYLYMV